MDMDTTDETVKIIYTIPEVTNDNYQYYMDAERGVPDKDGVYWKLEDTGAKRHFYYYDNGWTLYSSVDRPPNGFGDWGDCIPRDKYYINPREVMRERNIDEKRRSNITRERNIDGKRRE